MTDISEWYQRLPIFTRYWLSLTVGISLLARFGILPQSYLMLIPKFIWENWHVCILFVYLIQMSSVFCLLAICVGCCISSFMHAEGHVTLLPIRFPFPFSSADMAPSHSGILLPA